MKPERYKGFTFTEYDIVGHDGNDEHQAVATIVIDFPFGSVAEGKEAIDRMVNDLDMAYTLSTTTKGDDYYDQFHEDQNIEATLMGIRDRFAGNAA